MIGLLRTRAGPLVNAVASNFGELDVGKAPVLLVDLPAYTTMPPQAAERYEDQDNHDFANDGSPATICQRPPGGRPGHEQCRNRRWSVFSAAAHKLKASGRGMWRGCGDLEAGMQPNPTWAKQSDGAQVSKVMTFNSPENQCKEMQSVLGWTYRRSSAYRLALAAPLAPSSPHRPKRLRTNSPCMESRLTAGINTTI